MASLEPLEKFGNHIAYPTGGSFAEHLDWHLNHGTRPNGHPDRLGKRWSDKEFGAAVSGRSQSEDTCRKNSQNWRSGNVRPNDFDSIEKALFNSNIDYESWRLDLRAAFNRDDKKARQLKRNLVPRPPAHFLGREGDIAELLKWIDNSGGQPLLVQGGPGNGKTALTLALGNHAAAIKRFGDARWFAKLKTATTDAALRDAITRAIGADPTSSFDLALARIAAQPSLLILDNLETPWELKAERQAVEDTLAALADVRNLALLVSFRGREPVGGPAWKIHFVEHLAPPHDTELFVRHATGIRADDPDLAPLVAELGGIPLAIELVADRAYGLSNLAPLRRRWGAVGVHAATHRTNIEDSSKSLPRSIEISLDSKRIRSPGRRLFCLLGEIPAGISDEDCSALLGVDGYDASDQLSGTSLALVNNGRIDLLPPIRDYSARHCRPTSNDHMAWTTHYLTLLKIQGEIIGTEAGANAVGRLLPEFANINAAIRAKIEINNTAEVICSLTGLGRLVYAASLSAPILNDISEKCCKENDILGQALCIKILASIAFVKSDSEKAVALLKKSADLYRIKLDHKGLADCGFMFGEIALSRPDYETAYFHYDHSLSYYVGISDIEGQANCIHRIGDILLARSDLFLARSYFERALNLYDGVGYLHGVAGCIRRIGEIELILSDYTKAKKALDDALIIYKKIGYIRGEAGCLRRQGDLDVSRNSFLCALQKYRRSLVIYEEIGNLRGMANSFRKIADLLAARHKFMYSIRLYNKAMKIHQQVGDLLGEAEALNGLGNIARASSNINLADEYYKKSKAIYKKIDQ